MVQTFTSVQALTGDTPIYQLSVNQLLAILDTKNESRKGIEVESKEKEYVYGLSGLCNLLGCSRPTAQRIKDSGKIPFKQIGRKLIFEVEAVLSALNRPVQKKPHRYAKSSV